MEALRRTFQQFLDLFKSMSASQRGTLIVVPVMIVGAFGFLMFSDQSSSYTPVSWGKVFTLAERMSAEQAFIEAGLTDFHAKGQRIMVPKGEIDRYNAILASEGVLPADWTQEWERQFDEASPFASKAEHEERRRLARARIIRHMIVACPDYEDAIVSVARAEQRSYWRGDKPAVTATVSVRPRRGRQLTMRQVQSIRAIVAGGVPDLSPSNVIVQDQLTGISYTADDENDPFNSQLLQRIREFEQSYRSKIAGALSYIPNVEVAVNVDVENLKSLVESTRRYDEKTSAALRTVTRERRDTSSEARPQSEPGQVPNAPRQLTSSAGPVRQQESTEDTSETVTAPGYTTLVRESIAAFPKAVQVSVLIPEDYYRLVAEKRGLVEGATDQERAAYRKKVFEDPDSIQKRTEQAVQAAVINLIPPDSPPEAVNVTTFVPVEEDVPEIPVPVTETVTRLVTQWGGAAGLTLFALWTLWMLNRSLTKVPIEPNPAAPRPEMARFPKNEEEGEEDEDEGEQPLSKRDLLQNTVRDNPEVAATVLSKWIKAAK